MGIVCLCAGVPAARPGVLVPKSQWGQFDLGPCAQGWVGPAHGVCVCVSAPGKLSESGTLLRMVMLLSAAVCWTLLSDGLSAVPRVSMGWACNTSKVRKSNFSLYCALAVFNKIANPTPSPSLQTPLSLAKVYRAGGMHFGFRSLIKFAFLGALRKMMVCLCLLHFLFTSGDASERAFDTACLETHSGDGPILLCCFLFLTDMTKLSKNR